MTHVTCRLIAKTRDQLRDPIRSAIEYGLPFYCGNFTDVGSYSPHKVELGLTPGSVTVHVRLRSVVIFTSAWHMQIHLTCNSGAVLENIQHLTLAQHVLCSYFYGKYCFDEVTFYDKIGYRNQTYRRIERKRRSSQERACCQLCIRQNAIHNDSVN